MLLWGEVAVEKVLDGLPLDEKVAQREKYVGKTKGDRQGSVSGRKGGL